MNDHYEQKRAEIDKRMAALGISDRVTSPDLITDVVTISTQISEVAAADSAARAVALQVGYQLPGDSTDPVLICKDIATNIRRSVESCLEIGRALLVLKAGCGYGRFIELLSALAIERKMAARFMSAAQKFSNVATSRHLVTAAAGSQSKLLELLILDDEQIDELAETGQTGELALDDVACMGVRELRKAVRKLRADYEARGKVLEDKNKTIDELQERSAGSDTDEEDEDEPTRLIREAEEQTNVVVGALLVLASRIRTLRTVNDESDGVIAYSAFQALEANLSRINLYLGNLCTLVGIAPMNAYFQPTPVDSNDQTGVSDAAL